MVRKSRASRDKRKSRAGGKMYQPDWDPITYQIRPTDLISDDQLNAIHQAALKILSEIGVKVLSDKARNAYANAGFDVDQDTEMVRFDPAGVEHWIAQAPSEFNLIARNPERNLCVGGKHAIFASVGGPAYCMDNDNGRRTGTYAEMCDFMRLVQSLNIIHQEGGGGFEALDLPAASRHLDLFYAQTTLTDKNWQPWCMGEAQSMDALNMAAISLQKPLHELVDTPVFVCIINTNSPLQLDIPMAEGLMTMAHHGQVAVVTPFTLSGAMSPTTIAGALAQQHAEAMAGITLSQIVRPGVPAIYGGFTSNVDMRTGSPAFGTPEYQQAAQVTGQLARLIGVPFRSSNVTSANTNDAQAAYESMMSLWGAISGQAHLINHAAGWLGGGLTASFEKLIIDAEMLQMISAATKPFIVDDDNLGLDAIREVGPGGHFFGTAHTMERYETAFYRPMISNWDNFETWLESGSPTAETSANRTWKKLLQEYEQPPLDASIDAELQDYVERRKLEIKSP
jgi:trimethylamine--corrinoid protein Co-methyltransferase